MDPRAPAGQQMSSQPLSGDWSSGPVQTQQRLDRPTQQAAQAISGTPASSESSSQLLPTSQQQQQPQQPYQQSATSQQNPTHAQSGSSQPLNKDQQKWAGYDHTKEGPASATSQKAQAALDAVAKGPTNKTDPDKVDDHKGFGATDTGPGEADREDQGTTGLTGNADASIKGSWLTQLIARMWPYITAAAEKQAKEMLPDMLEENKPTWMTTLKLHKFELGDTPPTVEDVRVFPGTDPGAEDIFLEFDFVWRGDQQIALLLNPTPKFLQSVPGLSTVVNKIFTWTVGVSDISLKGRLRTTLIPLLFQMPVIGAVQVAFVDPPKLDFDLRLPSDSHGSGLLDYVSNWADAFICDKVLSQYVLPDHYFSQVDGKSEDILTPEGVMEVWMIEAENVPKMDFFGSGQPFGKMWLRPRSLKHTPTKKGSNPKWEREEAHYAMPVHTRVHQVLTVALLDHDSNGDDEIGRGHFNLGNLTPGELTDLWVDIGVPKKTGSEKKGSERKRDKILGFFVGAKGNQQKDVEGCRAHIQLLFHPLPPATVKAINKNQMKGQTPDPQLIQDPEMGHLVEKFNLMEEMFGNKAAGQVEANKQGKGISNTAAAAATQGASNDAGSSRSQGSSNVSAADANASGMGIGAGTVAGSTSHNPGNFAGGAGYASGSGTAAGTGSGTGTAIGGSPQGYRQQGYGQ